MEETVRELMISKFGRVIDLEALQTLSVNTTLEELKIKKLRKELSNAKELRMWEVRGRDEAIGGGVIKSWWGFCAAPRGLSRSFTRETCLS
jgi:hypothetical protein